MAATYQVLSLSAGKPTQRQFIYQNPAVLSSIETHQIDPQIKHFHQQLPDYAETALHSLPDIAKELGFGYVFVKDESTRFGLPSFKVAGASWAIHKALCQYIGISSSTSTVELEHALQSFSELRLVTCTEGNWGRATARMANNLGIRAVVYVPSFMEEYTCNLIRQEGAEVIVVQNADYDQAMAVAISESKKPNSLLVLDVGFDGFHDIPQWVSDGYSIIMTEVDNQVTQQTGGKRPDLVTCSVGAGGWAQAVVAYYKSQTHPAVLVSVEPEAAPCLKESLHHGSNTPVKTGHTIMNGMNCGTVSSVAWPILEKGIDYAVVVTDQESHACVDEMRKRGINAGPCGAANLAALTKLCKAVDIGERAGKIVVLLSTEGHREYKAPE